MLKNKGCFSSKDFYGQLSILNKHFCDIKPAGFKNWNRFNRYDVLEVWVKGNEGNVVIEVGKNIPEDMTRRNKNGTLLGPDGIVQTEDKNNDGILDVNEDTGLDGVYGEDSLNILVMMETMTIITLFHNSIITKR